MNYVRVDLHHSQVADPPEDIIQDAMRDFQIPNRKMGVMALKCWCVACQMNGWNGRETPNYQLLYAIFMSGFLGGYALRETEARESIRGN